MNKKELRKDIFDVELYSAFAGKIYFCVFL